MAIRAHRLSKLRLQRARALRGKRGVSEVLGTILILALTVVLFSSIFFFVSTFPKPATQPASQFQGQLYYVNQGTKTYINYLQITHLAGPAIVALNTKIYVVSQQHPQNTTTVYTLSSGGFGSSPSASWGVGQTWNLSMFGGPHLTVPDNITVTVVAQGTVVYRQTLPGTNPTIPPIFESYGDIPSAPKVNQTFGIFVQIADPFLATTSNSVYLNLTTPGLSCGTVLSTYPATTGQYRFVYNSTIGDWVVTGCKTATASQYYVTAWVTDTNPIQVQQNSIIFPNVVSSSSGGGGGGGGSCGSNTFSVATPTYTPSSPGNSVNVTITLTITNGNTCDWVYISGNWTATGGTQVSASTFGPSVLPVGGTLKFTFTWTTPAAPHHGSGAGSATIGFTVTSPSGATTSTPIVNVVISYT
jgi:flagellin-like protein